MHKILGSRLAEIYNTTQSKHTKKILENVSNIAKSSGLSIQQAIPMAEKALDQCKDDAVVTGYFQSDINAKNVIDMGISETLKVYKGLPIYEHDMEFRETVDKYELFKSENANDYQITHGFIDEMKKFMWNSKVSESVIELKNKAVTALPYMMISNAYDALEEYKGKGAYALMFQRLNTAMSLPANMVPQYIIKNMKDFQGVPGISDLVEQFKMMERSWLSRLMPKTTSVITKMGRFRTTGLNTPVVKMHEQTVFMINGKLFSINEGKSLKEFHNKKKLPSDYTKLYEGIIQQNAQVEDDMAICTTTNTNGHQVCVYPGEAGTSIFIDGIEYTTIDDAVNKMVEYGMDNSVMDAMLDIFAYCEGQIQSMDNAIQISDENNTYTTVVIVLEPNNISIMVMDNALNECKIYNNKSAIQTANFIRESYDLNISNLLKEGIEQEVDGQESAAIELAKFKQEMVDIELTIQKIETLDDEKHKDPEIQQYHQELLNRQKEIRNSIADAQSRADGKGGIDDGSPEIISGKIHDGFEKLRKNMLSIKDNDTNTTTLEGERIEIGDGLCATPVITVDEYQHDIVKSVMLRITDDTGSNAGMPERINQKFKDFGFSVVDGNELNVSCTLGSLDMPFDDTLKGSIEAIITKLAGIEHEDGETPEEENDEKLKGDDDESGKDKDGIPGEDDDDDIEDDDDKDNDYLDGKERGKDDGAKPPVPNKDDKGEKPEVDDSKPPVEDGKPEKKDGDTKPDGDTKDGEDGAIFKGELNKYDKDDLILIAKAKDKEMGGTLEKILSGTSVDTFDSEKLEALSKFLTDKGEGDLAAFLNKKTGKDGEDDKLPPPPKEKTEEEKEADINSTREIQEMLKNGSDLIQAIRETRILHRSGDKYASIKLRKLQEAIQKGPRKVKECYDANGMELKEGMTALDTFSGNSGVILAINGDKAQIDFGDGYAVLDCIDLIGDAASIQTEQPEVAMSEKINLKSRPTMESWKAALSSRHMKVRYSVSESRVIATSANTGKIIGVYPVNENETPTEGYINATLSVQTEQIPSNTTVQVDAQQFLSGTKDADIDVMYGGSIYKVPKSGIVVNLLESVNESTLLPFENSIIKSLFKEHKSVDQLADEVKEKIDEGLLGEIIGGVTGFALGNKIGEMVAKCLGVGQGILFDLLTSRLFGAAIGSAIGDNM